MHKRLIAKLARPILKLARPILFVGAFLGSITMNCYLGNKLYEQKSFNLVVDRVESLSKKTEEYQIWRKLGIEMIKENPEVIDNFSEDVRSLKGLGKLVDGASGEMSETAKTYGSFGVGVRIIREALGYPFKKANLYRIEGTRKGLLIPPHRTDGNNVWALIGPSGESPSLSSLKDILKDHFIPCDEDSRYLYSEGKLYASDEDGKITLFENGKYKVIREGEFIGSFLDFWTEKIGKENSSKELLIVEDQEEYEIYDPDITLNNHLIKRVPKEKGIRKVGKYLEDLIGVDYVDGPRELRILTYANGKNFKKQIKERVLAGKL